MTVWIITAKKLEVRPETLPLKVYSREEPTYKARTYVLQRPDGARMYVVTGDKTTEVIMEVLSAPIVTKPPQPDNRWRKLEI